MFRFFYTLFLILSIALFPWWVVVGLSLVGLFMFRFFWEMIIIGVLLDIMFFTPSYAWYQWGLHTLMYGGIFLLSVVLYRIFQNPQSKRLYDIS
jgi:hypothetical protein